MEFGPNEIVILYSSNENLISSGYYITKYFGSDIMIKNFIFSHITGNYIGFISFLENSYIRASKDENVNNFIMFLDELFTNKE